MDLIWRMKLREYSERFHTPLHEVMDLDPMFVLQHLYEARLTPSMVEEELEDILEEMKKIKDPEYVKISAAELEDFVDQVINKEIKRLGTKKAPTPETIETEVKQAETRPKSGSMDFKDLGKES